MKIDTFWMGANSRSVVMCIFYHHINSNSVDKDMRICIYIYITFNPEQ